MKDSTPQTKFTVPVRDLPAHRTVDVGPNFEDWDQMAAEMVRQAYRGLSAVVQVSVGVGTTSAGTPMSCARLWLTAATLLRRHRSLPNHSQMRRFADIC